MPITNPGCAPNVSVPQGTIFPNGVDVSPANPVIQETVRPLGWFFRTSPGYETVRRGAHKLQGPSRFGIHFAPIQLAEDISHGDIALVDKSDFTKNADVADLPGSADLDSNGKLSAQAARENSGTKLADTSSAPLGGTPHIERGAVADMGDRSPGRPLTVGHLETYFKNPVGAFKSDYSENPWMAILISAGLVAVVSMVAKDFEGAYRRRSSGSGPVGAAAAAPAAAVETAGSEVKEATKVANTAATAAGKAAEEAASAAGDAAEAAGNAAEEVAKAASDAVTE